MIFVARRAGEIRDIADLVRTLFPGNSNQQHAAAMMLLTLKSDKVVRTMTCLERQHEISRRVLQRARAKLARLGLIEYATWMNARYGGQEGWRLSSRMSTALRQLADRIDEWRADASSDRSEKDHALAGLLR